MNQASGNMDFSSRQVTIMGLGKKSVCSAQGSSSLVANRIFLESRENKQTFLFHRGCQKPLP